MFDPRIVEANLALKRIGSNEMPALAWDALEAGLDGTAIRRLASLQSPSFFELQPVLRRAMKELGLVELSPNEAGLRLAKARIKQILDTNADPLPELRYFYDLFRQADFCHELAGLAYLDDDVYLAKIAGDPEPEIRAWVLRFLRTQVTG
jgi:hypothetical protein